MVDLAVLSADIGIGTSVYAGMVMLGLGALLTSILCIFPQVKVRSPQVTPR